MPPRTRSDPTSAATSSGCGSAGRAPVPVADRAGHAERQLVARLEPHVGAEALQHGRDLLLGRARPQPADELSGVVLVLVEWLGGELRDADRVPLLEQQLAKL